MHFLNDLIKQNAYSLDTSSKSKFLAAIDIITDEMSFEEGKGFTLNNTFGVIILEHLTLQVRTNYGEPL